jgi:hypothetical protein
MHVFTQGVYRVLLRSISDFVHVYSRDVHSSTADSPLNLHCPRCTAIVNTLAKATAMILLRECLYVCATVCLCVFVRWRVCRHRWRGKHMCCCVCVCVHRMERGPQSHARGRRCNPPVHPYLEICNTHTSTNFVVLAVFMHCTSVPDRKLSFLLLKCGGEQNWSFALMGVCCRILVQVSRYTLWR